MGFEQLTPVWRVQLVIAIGLLITAGIMAVTIDMVARSRRIAAFVDGKEEEFARKTGRSFTHDGYFVDDNDRLLNEELPAADYSRGGVYLIGSSTVRAATEFWKLPAGQQVLIHNYGINQSDFTCQFQFLRHLIEHDDLLRAGGGKTLVIFGESYHNLSHRYDTNGYFVNLWKRHGLYQCTPDAGITPVRVNPIWRFLHFEENRIAGCLNALKEAASLQIWMSTHRQEGLLKKFDPRASNESWRGRMGPDWKEKISDGVEEFGRIADYLHVRGVNMVVVLLPVGSQEDELPYERMFIEEMTVVCKARQIPLHDWSRFLADEDLVDTSHANEFGAEKLQPGFLGIALTHLRLTRALP